MAEEKGAPATSISGNMLFYKQPELLNVKEHGNLGITPLTEQPFAFLRETQIVPVTVAEFVLAALNYPIIFAGEEKTPAVVMGIKQDTNSFVLDDGKMAEGVYIPAYVRRYPFASAKNDQDPNNLMVCIDRSSPMITENATSPFFNGTELTEATAQAVEFVKAYDAEAMGTANFVRAMNELDLFAKEEIQVVAPDTEGKLVEQKMGEYVGLSEEKLMKLPEDKIMALRDNGGLAAFYAHRLSQANWQRMLNMEMARDMQKYQEEQKS